MKISSKDTRILLTSDIHQNWRRLETILAKEFYDIHVSLGDYFDSHVYDCHADAVETTRLYKELLHKENTHILLGNHEMNYHYSAGRFTRCSGYSDKKDLYINAIITPDDWNKAKWFCTVDDFLCTHAGLGKGLIPEKDRESLDAVVNFLDQESILANRALANHKLHWFYGAGQSRGGNLPFGGILWSDWKREFIPIPGIDQLYGHTSSRGIAKYNSVYPNNICIDCELSEYLIIDNGKMEVKKYIDL